MGLKVLIIDDSNFQRKMIKKIVLELGHDVTDVDSAQGGLDSIKTNRFDFILCDLLMPEMDGFQFLEKMGNIGDRTPVIVVTADKQESTFDKVRELGAIGIVNKPPSAAAIDKIIIAYNKAVA